MLEVSHPETHATAIHAAVSSVLALLACPVPKGPSTEIEGIYVHKATLTISNTAILQTLYHIYRNQPEPRIL